jgi:flagellar hook-basal body complex protein FliE
MDHANDAALLRQIIRQLAELDLLVKTRLHQFLKGRSKDEMKDVLRELDKASLEMLCEMSLPDEDYEICQAVQEVLGEKKSLL